MKKIYSLFLTLIFILSLSLPIQASAQEFPLIMSGYTEDDIYYEIYGEILSQRGTGSQYVVRYVTYTGNVTPAAQISWEETMNGIKYTGTLKLTRQSYNRKENKTSATYEGYLSAK